MQEISTTMITIHTGYNSVFETNGTTRREKRIFLSGILPLVFLIPFLGGLFSWIIVEKPNRTNKLLVSTMLEEN